MRIGSVEEAVRHLRTGGIACFPTETLWSMSCLANNPASARRIAAMKGRPEGMALAAGFASWQDAWAFVDMTPGARLLAERFLPGPLTLVLRRSDDDLAHLAPGRDTLGIRIPAHPIARAILAATGPLVMTSANPHGAADTRTADEVAAQFPDVHDVLVVAADPVPCDASTIVDATGSEPVILREGVMPAAMIKDAWPAARA